MGLPNEAPLTTVKGNLRPLGFQQITVTQLAGASSLTVPTHARLAIIQAVGAAIYWRDDGAAPTSSIGMTIPAGGELDYNGNLSALQLIGPGATANISYYG